MDRGERYSRNVDGKLSGRMSWFGRNLSASALGVSSVWMNIVLLACADGAGCRTTGWLRGWIVGLCRLFEGDMGVARGASENGRVAVVVASL